jgi:hypothetical protein
MLLICAGVGWDGGVLGSKGSELSCRCLYASAEVQLHLWAVPGPPSYTHPAYGLAS